MKPVKLLFAVLAIWAVVTPAFARMPPALDIEGGAPDWLQHSFPDLFPGTAIAVRQPRFLSRRFANGNVLTIVDGVLYLNGPATGQVMKQLGPAREFRCNLYPGIAGCPPAFERMLPRQKFHSSEEQALVIRDQAAFASLWAHKIGPPSMTDMTIDWRERMVVGVVLGPRNPGCTSVFILSTSESAQEIELVYHVVDPFAQYNCEDPSDAASDFITLKRSPKPIHFIRVIGDGTIDRNFVIGLNSPGH